MQNKTNETLENMTRSHEILTPQDLIASHVVTVFLLAFSIWILISIVRYGIVTGKWKSVRELNEKFSAGMVYSSLTVCAVLCTLCLIVSEIQLSLQFDEKSVDLCDSISDTMNGLYLFVNLSVYVFLWLRQRVFYANSPMTEKFKKWVQFLSKIMIIPPIVCAIGTELVYSLLTRYNVTTSGCVIVPFSFDAQLVLSLAVSLLIIMGQALMFWLFWHALTINRKKTEQPKDRRNRQDKLKAKNKQSSSNSEQEVSGNTLRKPSSTTDIPNRIEATNNTVDAILKKTLVFTILLIILDVVSILFNLFFNGVFRRKYLSIALNLNVFLNLVFILLSFNIWQDIVFFACRKEKKKLKTRISSSTLSIV